jgi:prolipoprotein diacylglyceryltransferase
MQSFSLLLGLGTLSGLLLTSWRAPQKELLRYIDAAVMILFIALLGGRALFVAVHWTYYGSHLGEILQVWLGGLSGIGALAGGSLAVIIIALIMKLPMGVLADVLLPLAGTLTVSAWLGCWFDRCAYGLPSQAWWAIPQQDEWGVLANRVPVQLMGAAFTLILIWFLDQLGRQLAVHGLRGVLGVLAVSLVIFALSYLRADPAPIWNGLRLDAWGALMLIIVCLAVVVVLLLDWKFRKKVSTSSRSMREGGKYEG